MCTALILPDTVNSRGDKLSAKDMADATGSKSYDELTHNGGRAQTPRDPTKTVEMLTNWLTGGPLPSKVDPSKIFSEATIMHGVGEKVAAGQGVAGLFGFGSVIGDLSPKAPMKPGVPYSVPPVPNMIGSK